MAGTVQALPELFDHGSVGTGTSTLDVGKGRYHRIALTGATRTIAAPIAETAIEAISGGVPTKDVAIPWSGVDAELGAVLFIEIKNASGGAVTVTWNAAFKGAPANPANGQRRVHMFVYDGSNWVLMNKAADVPN